MFTFLPFTAQHPCSDSISPTSSDSLTTETSSSFITLAPSRDPTNNNSPNQTGAGGVRAIVAAVVVTAIVLLFMATIDIVAIVLRVKKGTKEGISNPAYGKWQ